MRRAARIAPRLRYGIHPMQVYAIFSCRVGLIKKKNGGKNRKTKGKRKRRQRRRIKKHTFRRRLRRRRRIRFSEYFLLITIQLPSRCNERARRRCLFGQLSMRTQVELLSSSRAGTMTWWRGSRVKAQ